MTTLAEATALLSKLVACPSVNPQRTVPTGPPYGEARMVALLAELLGGWGGAVTVTEVSPGRPNLLARFDGRHRGPALLLEAHSDTVAVGGMTIDPFGAVVRDGRLYGRGACDTKGPLAAMLLGLRAALDQPGGLPGPVWFVSTCNEESGATGAHALMASGFRVDAAVVAEPTNLEIVHAHKGALRVMLETTGVAVHSSAPERGVNAIYKMRPVLERLEREVAPALAAAPHPQLGPPTLSVGTIQGGTQVNVVPEACRMEVDRRLVPGEEPDHVVREMVEGLEVAASITEYYPPLDQPVNGPLGRRLGTACQSVLGRATFATAPWASNAGIFAAAGIPSLLFGPGSVAQAHTRDEWIELEQVVQAAHVFTALLG